MHYLVKYDIARIRDYEEVIERKSEVVEAKDASEARRIVYQNLIAYTNIHAEDIQGWQITGIKGFYEVAWLKDYEVSFVYTDNPDEPELYYFEISALSRQEAVKIAEERFTPIEIREVLERR